MKILLALVIALTFLACSSKPSMQPLVSEAPESIGLNQVKDSGFDTFFLHRDFSKQGYHAIMLEPLKLDNLEIDDSRLEFLDRDWRMTDKDRQRWREMFQKRASDTFSGDANEFTLAESAAPGVLKVEFEFVRFTPTAPKDDARSRPFNDKILTRSIGRLDIKINIVDSGSGDQLAYIEDSREVGDNSYPELERNNRITNDHKLRLEMSSWLSTLKSELNELSR